MKISTIVLALTTGLVLGLVINHAATKSANAEVYAVCQESRMSPDISEQRCGDLQNRYKIEFLCEQNNRLASNHCWTEENPQLGN